MKIKKQRKYVSEFAVSISSYAYVMTTAHQLTSGNEITSKGEEELLEKCHIYLICSKPHIYFNPDVFSYQNGIVDGELVYVKEGKKSHIPFSESFPLLNGAVDLRISPYPHRELLTYDKAGKVVRYFPASAFSVYHKIHMQHKDLSHFMVHYVGQSYADGNRNAFQRLKSHSTLQKILADISYKYPDDEVYVLMFAYSPYELITTMDGRDKNAISDERDLMRLKQIVDNPLKKKQQVCLTEAALIRYFQPVYNDIYKKNFPSNKHKILKECKDLDFSGLSVEISTGDNEFYLFTENIPPKVQHFISIELGNNKNRASFFHFFDGKEYKEIPPDLISGDQP